MQTVSDPRILEHEPGDLTCVVESGLRLSHLQASLVAHGQRLSLDPPGDPTLGDCLLDDLSGPLLHRFGTMRDLVIGVSVVLPDGLRASSGGKVVKNVAGYDLGKLFCGSRGRLGSVERVALRLHPLPAVGRRASGCARRGRRGAVGRAARAAGRAAWTRALGWECRTARAAGSARRVCGRTCGAAVEQAGGPTAGGAMQPELIADCVHCGFCLPSCPTYTLWHEEMDSPRGRIHLMSGLVDGTIPLTDTVAEHFDRCLGCMACVPACPSGVKYDRLIEQTRDYVEEHHRRPAGERLLRALIFGVFPHRRRLRAALALRRLPAPGPFRPLAAVAPPWLSPAWPPVHLPGSGPRVALLAGCVQSVVFGDVNAATARVLAADGYDVHVPRAQGCCGALHAHAGRSPEGVARARELERELGGYDYIVTNAAGCGSHLKDHGVGNVVDVSELLGSPIGQAERHPLKLKVAFQDSCHLKHAQRVEAEPRAALAQIPGLTVLEPAEQEICCGSAGLYNLVQPDAARELGRRKADHVLATGPDAYASGNPGCLLQVTAALRRAGRPLPAFHPIELIDASIRGIGPADLLARARR